MAMYEFAKLTIEQSRLLRMVSLWGSRRLGQRAIVSACPIISGATIRSPVSASSNLRPEADRPK
ncbi:MAG: hypothetical protein ACREB0_09475, partial [Sphingopyxis sp.]